MHLRAILLLDIALLIVTVSCRLIPQLCAHHFHASHRLYDTCIEYKRFFDAVMPRIETTLAMAQIWLVAIVAVGRYRQLADPIRHRSRSQSKLIVIIVLVAVALFRAPIFVVELVLSESPRGLQIVRNLRHTVALSTYRIVYHSIIDPLLASIVPVALMTVCSVAMLRKISAITTRGTGDVRSEQQPVFLAVPLLNQTAHQGRVDKRFCNHLRVKFRCFPKTATSKVP